MGLICLPEVDQAAEPISQNDARPHPIGKRGAGRSAGPMRILEIISTGPCGVTLIILD